MPASKPIDAALERLLPAGVTWAWSDQPDGAEPLLPLELDATINMSPDRLRSYRQGRSCARQALAGLGLAVHAVPSGEAREPVWPAGISGSISHSGDVAVAVAARQESVGAVGIDLEADAGPLEPEVAALICTAAERSTVTRGLPGDADRLRFAIKESVYKCVWPELRRFIDFREVEIDLRADDRSFRARPSQPAADLEGVLPALRGGYERVDGLLLAVAVLPGKRLP